MKKVIISILIISMLICCFACEDSNKQIEQPTADPIVSAPEDIEAEQTEEPEAPADPEETTEEQETEPTILISMFNNAALCMAVGDIVSAPLSNELTLYYELLTETTIKIYAKDNFGEYRKLKRLMTTDELEEIIETIPMKYAYTIVNKEGEKFMFYYKYLNAEGNVTQIEKTNRVVIADSVITISEEEYNQILAEKEAQRYEQAYQEYVAGGGTLSKAEWLNAMNEQNN